MFTYSQNIENENTDTLESLSPLYRAVISRFRRIATAYVFFNMLFFTFLLTETILFLVFLPFLLKSAWFALSISGIFLTVFSYFVLRFYYVARKPEQLTELKDELISSCKERTQAMRNSAMPHLSLAAALIHLASNFVNLEWQFYRLSPWLSFLQPSLARLTARFYWQDVFHFRQILLQSAIEEHLEEIRFTPTDLEVHTSLANTYVLLSQLFAEPKRPPNPNAYKKRKSVFESFFNRSIRFAIDEFQIINHFAPDDPWVHEQLANSYHSLHMVEEELKEIEILRRLRPNDTELLFRMGSLYFEQGQNALGLTLYGELKQVDLPKSEELISTYGKLNELVIPYEEIV